MVSSAIFFLFLLAVLGLDLIILYRVKWYESYINHLRWCFHSISVRFCIAHESPAVYVLRNAIFWSPVHRHSYFFKSTFEYVWLIFSSYKFHSEFEKKKKMDERRRNSMSLMFFWQITFTPVTPSNLQCPAVSILAISPKLPLELFKFFLNFLLFFFLTFLFYFGIFFNFFLN